MELSHGSAICCVAHIGALTWYWKKFFVLKGGHPRKLNCPMNSLHANTTYVRQHDCLLY